MTINFYNEDGTIKPFEDFQKEVKEVYDAATSEQTNAFLDCLISPQNEFEPEALIEKFAFCDRKIYINDEITNEMANSILKKIQFWNMEDEFNGVKINDREKIQVYINTLGGDLGATWLIIDAIQASKTPIITCVVGTAYSGGFFITLAGHERYAFSNATFMFHEGSSIIMGDAHKALQQSDFYEIQLKSLKKYVLKNTKISEEAYDEHKKDDWYFTTEMAIKYGVINEICENVNTILEDE